LLRHNLEVARRLLQKLRDQALLEKVDQLCSAERYADALDLLHQSIKDQEKEVQADKDRAAAVQGMASRLDRLAWFLAHCPDRRVRNPKAAVREARRATQLQPDVGDYWYTLATAHYRNGAWRESLETLETVKRKAGELDAVGWLLVAMNRHQQ